MAFLCYYLVSSYTSIVPPSELLIQQKSFEYRSFINKYSKTFAKVLSFRRLSASSNPTASDNNAYTPLANRVDNKSINRRTMFLITSIVPIATPDSAEKLYEMKKTWVSVFLLIPRFRPWKLPTH